jgi:hypothetical protein
MRSLSEEGQQEKRKIEEGGKGYRETDPLLAFES